MNKFAEPLVMPPTERETLQQKQRNQQIEDSEFLRYLGLVLRAGGITYRGVPERLGQIAARIEQSQEMDRLRGGN